MSGAPLEPRSGDWLPRRIRYSIDHSYSQPQMTIRGGSRQLLMHGMVLVLVGLVWGLVVPDTPYPRLTLGAHIQFVSNGMLFIVQATSLLALPNRVGLKSIWVMVLAAWLTWTMALSELAADAYRRRIRVDHRLGIAGYRVLS